MALGMVFRKKSNIKVPLCHAFCLIFISANRAQAITEKDDEKEEEDEEECAELCRYKSNICTVAQPLLWQHNFKRNVLSLPITPVAAMLQQRREQQQLINTNGCSCFNT